jgi:hypothetical protein
MLANFLLTGLIEVPDTSWFVGQVQECLLDTAPIETGRLDATVALNLKLRI